MRRVKMLTFKDLVNENKKELMRNDKEMEAIEKRLDEKYARRAKYTKTGS
ncbi:FbpB family small basic protein [Pueribacillus sp. YX66]